MSQKILRRFLRMITLMLGLSILTFWLIHLSPIDPVNAYAISDTSMSQEQLEKLKEYWGG